MGESAASTIAAVLERDPAPVSDLRPGLPRVAGLGVKTCIQKAPDDRWQTARDLELQLDRLRDVQSETTTARSLEKRRPVATRRGLRSEAGRFSRDATGARDRSKTVMPAERCGR